MEYTVQKLGVLAGISTRTLRYYDEIGILKPARVTSSGYRIYGEEQVDRLQQILFYRELGVSLDEIKNIVTSKNFEPVYALQEHLKKLLDKKEQLDKLIANVNKTIQLKERGIKMSDKEKFEGFKRNLIDDNEKKYGNEIREKYGEETVNRSNQKLKNMTQEEYNEIEKLSNDIIINLIEAFKTGDPAGDLAQKAVKMHRKWLTFYWDSYSKEAHAGIGQMYVEDPRFKSYYDKHQKGLAEFLRDAILVYTGTNK